MTDLILTTYDWVPPPPRGFVRDLRIRWALEEAGLPYRVESTPFRDRGPDHLAHQPFAQVPWLTDGDLSLFESGAILLHLGQKSTALMPADPAGRRGGHAMGLRRAQLGRTPCHVLRVPPLLRRRRRQHRARRHGPFRRPPSRPHGGRPVGARLADGAASPSPIS